ncbi:uncharacterized protein [Littorina saxatilis]|uniref:Uncharacterized protein n=1 Tax=Littorina saxatilis TaxID=31220 RepID=A0AAN9GJL6_9CAEN
MASVQFQIHTDKENATATGLKTIGGGLQGGKSFQAHKTPRRALGLVNEAHRVGLGPQVPAPQLKGGITSSLSAHALKPKNGVADRDSKLKQRQQVDKENPVQKAKQHGEKTTARPIPPAKQQHLPTWSLPDIEYMPPPSPPRDDDEDMLPVKDRASTYVHKLLSWRPQCLFGAQPDSEEEEEEEERERQRIMEELDNLPALNEDVFPMANLHLSCEELDVDSLELPTMDDLLIPEVPDDSLDCTAQTSLPQADCSASASLTNLLEDSADISLPRLEDSADISLSQVKESANTSLNELEDSASAFQIKPHGCAQASVPQLDDSSNVSLTQLDDSLLGLEQHLGSLEIKDYSLPSTPSH